MNNKICLRRTTVTVTMRCSLRCKLCSAGVAEYAEPPHFTAEYVSRELKEYFSIVDYVEWLQYSGGEPFLNSDLPQMVEEAMNYRNQFDKLMIFANGTILPSEKMLDTFCKYRDKIHFFFSNYGEKSYKGEELISVFERNKLDYSQKKYYGDNQLYGGWVDFGNWEKRNRSSDELKDIFSKCGMHTMGFTVIQSGEMHLCRRSYHGMYFDLIPRKCSDSLDILDPTTSTEEKREQLIKMMNLPYIEACDYCNATYGVDNVAERFEPAEQYSKEELDVIRRDK